MNRLYNLDYLRGLAALSIMLYHYLSWTYGRFSSDTFLGRIGIYGVSIFYMLSGLTLYHVYYKKMQMRKNDLAEFYKKRFLRIFPLLWLVNGIVLVTSNKRFDLVDVILNLTGLFGFVKWDVYFSSGIWSIGNELVFYAFFPFFVYFMKKKKLYMVLLSSLIVFLYLYFAFIILTNENTIESQWRNYTNPLNQVLLFLIGFLIGHYTEDIKIKRELSFLFLISAVVIFVFYPVIGDTISLVTSLNRLIFTVLILIICLTLYKLDFKLPTLIHSPLLFLGEISYSIYLLHPIVWSVANKLLWNRLGFSNFSIGYKIIITIIFCLLVSYVVYRYFERYFMKLKLT